MVKEQWALAWRWGGQAWSLGWSPPFISPLLKYKMLKIDLPKPNNQSINCTLFCHKLWILFAPPSPMLWILERVVPKGGCVVAPVSCCSGSVSCIYFWGSARRERESLEESLAPVCKCQIFKMQRIYMHSHEHFEVFTTVLAPQGEWNHICSEAWLSMTLLTLPERGKMACQCQMMNGG